MQRVQSKLIKKNAVTNTIKISSYFILYAYHMAYTSHVVYQGYSNTPGLILGLCPANERRRYFVTPSLIGWVQALYQPCTVMRIAALTVL